jgi:HAD superfamily hydrolase (TIGR01490 family)
MKKEIAFFDFDGTITSKDTMLVFLRYLSGNLRYALKMLLLTPVFAALKAGLVSNHRAKEIMLTSFIGGMKEADLIRHCSDFSTQVLPSIIRPAALECILQHQHNQTEVVVVSAAPQYWVRDWCKSHNITLIATELEVIDGVLTGKLKGANCHGMEKVKRIFGKYDLTHYSTVHAYGDTPSDQPMLSLAAHAHYKPFR